MLQRVSKLHFLGSHTKNQNDLASDSMKDGILTDELSTQDKNMEESILKKVSEESSHLRRNSNNIRNTSSSNAASLNKRNDQTTVDKDLPLFSQERKQGLSVSKDYMKKEHLGVAKRMFARALGMHSGKDGSVPRSRSGEIKKN
ncbi:hypothetical protein JHK87_033612 [Glycine soja]|nr:hypothetical protein JHK87_033612 [Glycine soja]